jgi:hypothetical protein
MKHSVLATILALLGAFFLAPGILLTLGGTDHAPQAISGVLLLALGIGSLYAAARYTNQRYLLIGISILFTMLLVFAMSLFLVSKLG